MSPATSAFGVSRFRTTPRKDSNMPEMFDWIFFAIILLPSAYLVWDWLRNR